MVSRAVRVVDEEDDAPSLGWRPWPMVIRWCHRCGCGPPGAFYNSRGLCNVCHKTLRHRHGPSWDVTWAAAAWGCAPTGQIGQVAQGTCSPRCGEVRRLHCDCGGPGGIGLPMAAWMQRLHGRAQAALLEGDLVPSLDAWEILPPEISTHIDELLTSPATWLADHTTRGAMLRLQAEKGAAAVVAEAARVANAVLYRWWRNGPGVPGPGTVFVPAGGTVKIAHASPKRHIDTEVWPTRIDPADWLWDQTNGTDPTPAPLDAPENAPAIAKPTAATAKSLTAAVVLSQDTNTIRTQLRRKVSGPLGDAAVAAGLARPQEWIHEGRCWELGWSVGADWLAMYGVLGDKRIEVYWSSLEGGITATEARLDTAPWREFFLAAAARRAEATQAITPG